MRIPIIIALLLLIPFAQASILNVKVVVDQDTPSIGAVVSMVTGGVALYTQKAGQNGVASFNVTDGSYFITINRSSIYPEYIVLNNISGNTNITIVRRQLINYANAYGQIAGPASFANTTVSAYMNGQVAKRTNANKDGFYMLQFLNEGTYELRFESPGYVSQSVQVFLPSAEFTPVYQMLQKPEQPPEAQPILSSPVQAPQFSVIEIALTKGGAPFAGQEITVGTPSGQITAKTNSNGIALVNAAEGGVYSFSYGNQTATTTVQVAEVVPPVKNETPSQPSNTTQPEAPSAPAQQGGNWAALIVVAVGIFGVLVLAAAAILATRLARDAKKDESKERSAPSGGEEHHAHQHAAGHHQHEGYHAHDEGKAHPRHKASRKK